ncbi:MAG: hypothetical protein V4621_01165 [Pseudomonadota bacterium]
MTSSSPTATLRQGILTLSFPDAAAPTLWQLALSDFSLVGFALRSTDKHHELVMTTDADTPRVLAHYTDALTAQQALRVVLSTIQGRAGCSQAGTSCTAHTASSGCSWFRCILRWVLRLVLLALLLWIGFTLWRIFGAPMEPISLEPTREQSQQVTPQPIDPTVAQPPISAQPRVAPPQTGVPLSADDVLGE